MIYYSITFLMDSIANDSEMIHKGKCNMLNMWWWDDKHNFVGTCYLCKFYVFPSNYHAKIVTGKEMTQ